jgi:hypothetical protein
MPKGALSPKFWSRRCDRLFDAADRLKKELEDLPYNHPFWRGESATSVEAFHALRKFQKMNRLYEQAAQVAMMLQTLEQFGNEETRELLKREREEAVEKYNSEVGS